MYSQDSGSLSREAYYATIGSLELPSENLSNSVRGVGCGSAAYYWCQPSLFCRLMRVEAASCLLGTGYPILWSVSCVRKCGLQQETDQIFHIQNRRGKNPLMAGGEASCPFRRRSRIFLLQLKYQGLSFYWVSWVK
jgi:hypothetical protein